MSLPGLVKSQLHSVPDNEYARLSVSPAGVKLAALLRSGAKAISQGVALLAALPFSLLAGFGRFSPAFQGFGQLMSLVPGLPGDYLRGAYYFFTLRKLSLHSRISFGSFFAHSSATVGRGVYIGAYCVLGACEIGERTQIASHVQILSGRHQHGRTANGRILGGDETNFKPITIGPDCWIGASAIVMADIEAESTVGAGAVVTRSVPRGLVVVGNPARPIERDSRSAAEVQTWSLS